MSQIKYQLRFAIPIWLIQLLCAWLPDNKYSIRIRGCLVAHFLPTRPKNFTLGRDVTLLGINKLNIGSNVYLAKGTWINAHGGIFIEDNVLISPYVVLASLTHGYNGENYLGKSTSGMITVGEGAWLAAHSTITSGVQVGKASLIAANSVVIKSTESHAIYSGVPAVKIKDKIK